MNFKTVFVSWEKLRIVYNAVLLVILIIALTVTHYFNEYGKLETGFVDLIFRILIYAMIANMLYFAGPICESYLRWIGAKKTIWRGLLFSAGLIVSIVLEIGVLSLEFTPF